MLDEFSEYYADFLDGTYDCVDRIVLNAYFQLGQGAGGFRTWWRQLKGSDDDLDNAHLMRMAGRLSRRVRAHAEANHIPLIDCKSGERKHEIAELHIPADPDFVGVYLILVGRAPVPLWDVQRSKTGKIVNIVKKKPWPYVNHYSFYIIAPEWVGCESGVLTSTSQDASGDRSRDELGRRAARVSCLGRGSQNLSYPGCQR